MKPPTSLAVFLLLTGSYLYQVKQPNEPSLKETIKWMDDFSDVHGRAKPAEFPNREILNHFVEKDGCSINLEKYDVNLENAVVVGKQVDSISLSDLAPEKTKIKNETAVYFEVSDSSFKIKEAIISADGKKTEVLLANDSISLDSKDSASRFLTAFQHAIKLCGGVPALF